MGVVAADLAEATVAHRADRLNAASPAQAWAEAASGEPQRAMAAASRLARRVVAQCRTAPVTAGLLLSLVAIWLVEHALIGTVHGHRTLSYLGFGALPNVSVFHRGSPGQWWRYTSTGLLHSRAPYHLAINAVGLALVGGWVERVYGRLAVLATVILGVAVGSVVFVVVSAMDLVAEPDFTVGISAGICALVGVMLVHGYRRRAEMGAAAAESIKLRAALAIALMVLIGLVLPRLNNDAHGGGLACGLLLGRLLPPRGGDHESAVAWQGRVALVAVVLAGALSMVMAAANLTSRLLEH